MVYSLIALSPGGFSASASAAAGGGSPTGGDPRIAEARFRDRFGLDEPLLTQYLQWLGRVSPVKFGERAQIDSTGERIYPPAKPPQMIEFEAWVDREQAKSAATIATAAFTVAPSGDEARSQYRAFARENRASREAFVTSLATLRIALAQYAEATGQGSLVDARGEVQASSAASLRIDKNIPQWAAVKIAADAAQNKDPLFQDALDAVQAAKYSPGRFIANLLLPGSLEGSGFLYKGISGTVDAAYRIFADPTLALGKAKKAYDAGDWLLYNVIGKEQQTYGRSLLGTVNNAAQVDRV
ncbi:MAG: hypothetical protein EBY29_13250, partial [Planctomycetes bacterium]|nr:hypothetical protein [Planctomycetota bacterium]